MPPWMFALTVMTADTLPPAARADPWFAPDKVKHAVVAFSVQSGAYAALRGVTDHGGALAGASLATIGVSLLKERLDRTRTGFSVRDLAWDAAGAVVASLILSHAPRR